MESVGQWRNPTPFAVISGDLKRMTEDRDRLRKAMADFLAAWDRHADWESRHSAVEELRKQSR